MSLKLISKSDYLSNVLGKSWWLNVEFTDL